MDRIDVTQARIDLSGIIDPVLEGGRIMITSEKGNAVLLSEEEWSGLMETLYVMSDPDTISAVREARATPTSELETIDWKNVLTLY